MDPKKFEIEFGKIFYLTVKKQLNEKLSSFLKWKETSQMFKVFYKCLHSFKAEFPKYRFAVPNYKQKKRFYTLFKSIDKKKITLGIVENEFKEWCHKSDRADIFQKVQEIVYFGIRNIEVMQNSVKNVKIINSTAEHSYLEMLPFNYSGESDLDISDGEKLITSNGAISGIERIVRKSCKSSKNKDVSVEKGSVSIELTNTNDDIAFEYTFITKKIKSPAVEKIERDGKITYTINLDNAVTLFIFENINHQNLIKFIYGILRHICKSLIPCYLIFTTHSWNKNNSKLRIYSKCMYEKDGCKKYNFYFNFKPLQIIVKIVTSTNDLKHPKKNLKIPQIRGARRDIFKYGLKNKYPSEWRDNILFDIKYDARGVINVPSKDVTRKIRSEQTTSKNRSVDHFEDISRMYQQKNWKQFIQSFGKPQFVFLFTEEQLTIVRELIEFSRNTLFVDATGSVMKQWESKTKRVFLYTLILHVKFSPSEPGILLPVAEGFLCNHFSESIESFLNFVRLYCLNNKIAWPFAKRVCVDFSWALINAILESFNRDANVRNLETYLEKSFNLAHDTKLRCNFTIVQICCSHMCRIIQKDIANAFEDPHIRSFVNKQLFYALNISSVKTYWEWLENMFTLLLNEHKSKLVTSAEQMLKKYQTYSIDDYLDNKADEKYNSVEGLPQYTNSPFYMKGLQIFNTVKSKPQDFKKENNIFYNEKFASILLKKYTAYCPLWTNIIAKLVDDKNTRISNGPVESYFKHLKNEILCHKRYVRATTYVRHSYKYIKAKINEIKLRKDFGSPNRQKNKIKMPKPLEDTWKRTPKKIKNNINPRTLFYEKLFKSIPSKAQGNYPLFRYKHIFEKNYQNNTKSILFYEISLHTYLSLNPENMLYNTLVDIYINILIYESKKSYLYSLSTEECKYFFHGDEKIHIPLNCFRFIVLPICNENHFTIVFLDTHKKEFAYINPFTETKIEISAMFDTFKKKTAREGWRLKLISHDKQNDSYNCGVHICQFAECFIKSTSMTNLESPDIYRLKMKNKFVKFSEDMTNICLQCGGNITVLSTKCFKCCRYICNGCFTHYYKNAQIKLCNFCRED